MQEEFNNEFNDEAVTLDEQALEDNIHDGGCVFDEVEAQKINIPKSSQRNRGNIGKGVKVFCIALVATVLLSCFSFGGYFLGKNSSTLNKPQSSTGEITLQSKPANENSLSATDIYTKITPSVVGILVYNDSGDMSEASGVVYSEDGYIVTNDHIYSSISSAKFKIYTNDKKEYNAYYVAGDTRSDLAILKISENVTLPVADFGDSDSVISGEKVCAIGCPNGYSSVSTITTGIVSAPKVRATISSSYSSNFIQTDTAINPGNSGGALVNEYGQIIGITSSKISGTSYEGVGFAIPTKTVKKVAESLVTNGNVKSRARLGISYNFYNSAMAELAGIGSYGLYVREVSADSDLYGKLEVDDIITRVNDIAITDDAIILDLLEESKPGDRVLLTVLKSSGETTTLSAVLLSDEGSSSYVNDNSSGGEQNSNEEFNWPEGF